MKKIILSSLGLILILSAFAQNESAREKIENAKIALITKRLDLSPEQAEKFWPIYNEYSRKHQKIREEFSKAKINHDPKTASEEENQRLLQLGMKVKERALELEKEYSNRMLKIISNRQLMSLRKAESDFKKMLLNRLRKRQQMQQRRQEMNRRRDR